MQAARLRTERGACRGVVHHQNAGYLDCLGAVLAETGAQEEAVQALQKAVALQPDQGFAKYMCASVMHCSRHLYIKSCVQAIVTSDLFRTSGAYPLASGNRLIAPDVRVSVMHRYLGQLLKDEEAIAALRQGITVLQTAIDTEARPSNHCRCFSILSVHALGSCVQHQHLSQHARCASVPEEKSPAAVPGGCQCWRAQDHREGAEPELRAQLCSALCCLAESLLGAEGELAGGVGADCERLLLRAAQADAGSPEPMQVAFPASPTHRLAGLLGFIQMGGQMVIACLPVHLLYFTGVIVEPASPVRIGGACTRMHIQALQAASPSSWLLVRQ